MSAALLILTGCAGTSDLVFDELSEAEARSLAGAMMFATFNSTSVVPPAPSATTRAGALATGGWAADFEAEVRCPLGGVVGVATSIVVAEDATGSWADYRMIQVHNECGMASAESRDFTLWGSPRMEATVSVHHGMTGAITWMGATTGSVDWVAGGGEGSCSFDLTFTGRREDLGSPSAVATGTICGYSLDDSVSID